MRLVDDLTPRPDGLGRSNVVLRCITKHISEKSQKYQLAKISKSKIKKVDVDLFLYINFSV